MRVFSATEFQTFIQGGATLLDVRTAEELEIAQIAGAVHIPLAELQQRIGELNPQQPIGVLCHHGMRSEMAARFLERSGFVDVVNLSGGIDAWAEEVDPSLPRY